MEKSKHFKELTYLLAVILYIIIPGLLAWLFNGVYSILSVAIWFLICRMYYLYYKIRLEATEELNKELKTFKERMKEMEERE